MMKNKVINNKGQARLFKHPALEMLSKTSPWVIYTLYIPINAFLIYYAYTVYHYQVLQIVAVFMIAMLSWTLAEYLIHRFLFHFEAKSDFGKRLVYVFHENHHEFPRDKSRLFMPPLPSLIMSSTVFLIFCAICYLFTGTIGYAFVFCSGFITGYLFYVTMHYAIHVYAPPKYLKILWRNHYLHHYKYPDRAFGVSSMFWDKVFGTFPKQDH